jgi:hypothetical protein
MKVLELFSGTQSISKAFREKGHETFTVEFNPKFTDTDWTVDVFEVNAKDIVERFGKPDVIWSSPPCTKFSVAAVGRNWTNCGAGIYEPKNKEAELAMELVKHTLKLIHELDPSVWFMENPRGMLRKMDFMQSFDRHTIAYCQYGDFRQKPTDIFTNHPNPEFKPMCSPGSPCHEAAPRGSRTGTQGMKNAMERARIPHEFCLHIADICEDFLL